MKCRIHRRSLNIQGHAHELTFCCYQRYPFLDSTMTCQWLCESIESARLKYRFLLHAFVIMPEHVHLIVLPMEAKHSIANILSAIKSPVGRKAVCYLKTHSPTWLNKITRQRGRRTERLFWQSGGGYNRNLTSVHTLWTAIDYVHANPVRRGLAGKEVDWYWSSAAMYAGLDRGPLSIDPPDAIS